MSVMRAMLLFDEHMNEKRHSTGSCLRILMPGRAFATAVIRSSAADQCE